MSATMRIRGSGTDRPLCSHYRLPVLYRTDVKNVRANYRAMRRAGVASYLARSIVIQLAVAFDPKACRDEDES